MRLGFADVKGGPGVTADGALVYATGPLLTPLQLAQLLVRAGVVRGIHFADVPPGQAKYVTCVRGAVLDDVELLWAVKRAGGHGTVVDGTALATCRMYDGWAELEAGYRKSLWAAFGSPAGATAVTAALLVTYVVPFLAAVRGSRPGLVGYAAGVVGRVLVARRVGGRVWPDSLAHPVSVSALAVLTARSVRGHRAGTLTWKGRPLP